ncbi:hypothetical protein FNF28_01221 [Cafeteria roenbergensis]|nr:hypothetical protein FNF28_01221 [Cafeteria roenbergensis]
MAVRAAAWRAPRQALHASAASLKELPPGPAPGTVIPVGITKDGQDPVVLEDSEYPEWLFRVGAEESETTEEMLSKGVKNLSYLDSAKLFRMLRRDKIKQHNSTNRKVA